MDESFVALIKSDRVSHATQAVMASRLQALTTSTKSSCLSDAEYALLVTVLGLMVPQDPSTQVDIASLVASAKCRKEGNGWRYASMPADDVSLAIGLRLLEKTSQTEHQLAFQSLEIHQQITLLSGVQDGNFNWSGLDCALWFEELLADAVQAYISQPSTMALMGFDGFAFLPQWAKLGLNTAEPWEPAAQ